MMQGHKLLQSQLQTREGGMVTQLDPTLTRLPTKSVRTCDLIRLTMNSTRIFAVDDV